MSLRVIFDKCEPREEVLRGDLRDAMFAPRLRDVMEDRADPVYQEDAFAVETETLRMELGEARRVSARQEGA